MIDEQDFSQSLPIGLKPHEEPTSLQLQWFKVSQKISETKFPHHAKKHETELRAVPAILEALRKSLEVLGASPSHGLGLHTAGTALEVT